MSAFLIAHIINSFGYWCVASIYYSCDHEWAGWTDTYSRYQECKYIWESPLNDKELTLNHWTNVVVADEGILFTKIMYHLDLANHYPKASEYVETTSGMTF